MKNEKIEKQEVEVEEEKFVTTKKVQWKTERMQERVFNLEV